MGGGSPQHNTTVYKSFRKVEVIYNKHYRKVEVLNIILQLTTEVTGGRNLQSHTTIHKRN